MADLLKRIWKKLKEDQSFQKAIIYPNFQGVDFADNVDGEVKIIKVNDCIGNEPGKDFNYFNTEKKDYVEKMIKSAKEQGIKSFPPIKIGMDAQGGGVAIEEGLHDPSKLEDGEHLIWPSINYDKSKDTDGQAGLHILELIQFARAEWTSQANHGLRKDLEDKLLLFPRFDPVTIGLSIEEDKANNRLYDTLEDCVMEIEELKNELSLIEVSESVNGRMRWDTPEVKIGVGKKQRMRKDRYSSLVMANMAARNINLEEKQIVYFGYGGFASRTNSQRTEGTTFSGPNWFTSQMNNVY